MHRELRRKEKAMNQEEAKKFLTSASVGRLGLSFSDYPYVVPLHYVYLNEKIYFHCSKKGKKIDYITKNSKVCFEVDEELGIKKAEKPCDYETRYKSVIAFGKATFVDKLQKKLEILKELMEKYANGDAYSPLNKEMTKLVHVVEIAVDKITGKQNL